MIRAFANLLPYAERELREKIATRIGAEGKDVLSLLSALPATVLGELQFLAPDRETFFRAQIFYS